MGIPGHPIEDVKLNNILILIKGGAPKEQALKEPGELEKSYPDPQEFGEMPAYGFFIRHAKNIELNHVELKLENDDFRPAIILDDVTGANFNYVKAGKVTSIPTFSFRNVQDINISNCSPTKDRKIRKSISVEF